MKKILFVVLLSCCAAQTAEIRDPEALELKENQDDVTLAASGMTFIFLRHAIGGLFEKPKSTGAFSFDLRPLCALMIPGALIADTIAFVAGAVATPILEGRVLAKKAIFAIDTYINDHEPDVLTQMTLEGYKVRLLQVEALLKDQKVSLEIMLSLLLANTAWDSKDCAPKKLVLGNGQKLKRIIIEKHAKDLPEGAVKLFNLISAAAEIIEEDSYLKILSHDDLIKGLIAYLTDDTMKYNYGFYMLKDKLLEASITAKEILALK